MLPSQHLQEERAGQQREHDIVLGQLTAASCDRPAPVLARCLPLILPLIQRPRRTSWMATPHSNSSAKMGAISALRQVERPPLLFRKMRSRPVTDVVVHAADIGAGVMLEVVRLAPVVAGRDDVPLVSLAVEMRVAHPVVLTMHDVVTQLHVVDDLRQAEQQRCRESRPVGTSPRTAAHGRRLPGSAPPRRRGGCSARRHSPRSACVRARSASSSAPNWSSSSSGQRTIERGLGHVGLQRSRTRSETARVTQQA